MEPLTIGSGVRTPALSPPDVSQRLHALDAARAFALLLGVVFHASLSLLPFSIGWAVQDSSTSTLVAVFALVSHSFRMELFFLLAGWLGWGAFHRRGAGRFVRGRAFRLIVPFVVGWFVLRPLLVSGWIMGAASRSGDYEFGAALVSGFLSLGSLPAGLFTGSHLWFLYYLVLATALVLGLRAIAQLLRIDRPLRAAADRAMTHLGGSRLAIALCSVPVAVALLMHQGPGWGMPTPDRSLRPHWTALLVYGGFFAFGWLLARMSRPEPLLRVTPGRCVAAVISLAATLVLSGMEADRGHPYREFGHAAYSLAYACMMWSLVLLTLGVFWRLCAAPRPWIRYLADSAYWTYLAHLPIVVWLQVAVAELPVHWSLKLGFIFAATMAACLLSYGLIVRPLLSRRRPPLRALAIADRGTPRG